MKLALYDKLEPKDFANSMVRIEIRQDIKIADLYRSTFTSLENLLKQIEHHCPCGARPESPRTHPHVLGCPVEEALIILKHTKDAEDGIRKLQRG